jgi:hypothetical protein
MFLKGGIVKKLFLFALLVPALVLAIYDMDTFDVNRWRTPIYNDGRWGIDITVGTGDAGGTWPQPLHNCYVFGAGQWFGAIVGSAVPETLCTMMYNQNSGGSEACPALCRYWRGGTGDSLDRVYQYPGGWPPPASRFPMAPQVPHADMEMWCGFGDSTPENHVPPGHPLGIDVYATVYGFSDSLAQDFFYLKYELANCSGESLRQAYFGMMFDADIGVYTDDMIGLIRDRLFPVGQDTIRVQNTGYAYDYDTIENPGSTWESGTPGIVAVFVLSTPDSLGLTAFKKFTCEADTMTDADQYLSLAGYDYRTGTFAPYDTVDTVPGDKVELLATGPYDIAPDSVLTFWYVIIASPCDLSELAIRHKRADSIYVRRLTGIAESRPSSLAPRHASSATIVRGVLLLPRSLDPSISRSLLDISGRKVADLHAGPNDVSRLSPGVYFVRGRQAEITQKVILTK